MTSPDRVWLDWPNANRGEPVFDHPPENGFQAAQTQYVRRDPAVLAALPEVRALVEAETERCAKVAEAKASEWWGEYKDITSPHAYSSHREGMSDGADAIAAAQPAPDAPSKWPAGFFHLTGDTLHLRCATEGCGQRVRARMEVEGIGSDYCEPCILKIIATVAAPDPDETTAEENVGILSARVDSLLAENALLRRQFAMGKAAPDPAAIRDDSPNRAYRVGYAAGRAAALREAENSLRDWQDDLNTHRMPETAITVGMAADVVADLIAKGAAE